MEGTTSTRLLKKLLEGDSGMIGNSGMRTGGGTEDVKDVEIVF